ncbi:sensor histidine kinase [Saccharopolyspora spinosa]|uniref:histidine kinase n=1 Tax=Saccharopolyspora spinosa TaxID=60894 RepID=A0A2N3XTW2_SACSN|nr:histidine kinase [Saccharopolyspora spinosa]PKW14128.1 signal transduction histidine kinase [Saccharopolyspora spinosa]
MRKPIAPVIGVAPLVASLVYGEIQAGTGAGGLILDISVGALAFVLVAALFRWPVPIAVVLAALAAVSATATPPATLATLVVAKERRIAVACQVATAGIIGHAIRGLWRPLPGLPLGWWLVLDVVAHAGLLGWGLLIRARQELIDSLRERARRAEAEQGRRVAEARAAERTALAREMHDVLAHRLSLVATYAGALEYRQDIDPPRLAQAAGVIREGVHQALDELREVISVLREDTEEPARLGLPDLAALVAETRRTGTRIDFQDHTSGAGSLPLSTGRTGYRIVQEGLTNARKHAAGQPVRVTVAGAPGEGLRIDIRNPVGATTTVPGTGTGLVGLTERVRLTGGQLDHELTSSGEFRLHASLPWPV